MIMYKETQLVIEGWLLLRVKNLNTNLKQSVTQKTSESGALFPQGELLRLIRHAHTIEESYKMSQSETVYLSIRLRTKYLNLSPVKNTDFAEIHN